MDPKDPSCWRVCLALATACRSGRAGCLASSRGRIHRRGMQSVLVGALTGSPIPFDGRATTPTPSRIRGRCAWFGHSRHQSDELTSGPAEGTQPSSAGGWTTTGKGRVMRRPLPDLTLTGTFPLSARSVARASNLARDPAAKGESMRSPGWRVWVSRVRSLGRYLRPAGARRGSPGDGGRAGRACRRICRTGHSGGVSLFITHPGPGCAIGACADSRRSCRGNAADGGRTHGRCPCCPQCLRLSGTGVLYLGQGQRLQLLQPRGHERALGRQRHPRVLGSDTRPGSRFSPPATRRDSVEMSSWNGPTSAPVSTSSRTSTMTTTRPSGTVTAMSPSRLSSLASKAPL